MANEFVLVSDLHGNYPALQQVVEQEGFDAEYLVLGDVHGLLGYPQEVQTMVQSLDGHVIAGNHDKAIFHYGEGHVNSDALSRFEVEHTLGELSAEQQEWMEERQFLDVFQRGASRICISHALPWPDMASGYEAGNAGILKGQVTEIASTVSDDYDYVFHGHTHTQYSLDCSRWGHDVTFVNPGSLGYQQTYSIVETDSGDVTHKSVEYDEDVQSHVQSILPDDAPHTNEWF